MTEFPFQTETVPAPLTSAANGRSYPATVGLAALVDLTIEAAKAQEINNLFAFSLEARA